VVTRLALRSDTDWLVSLNVAGPALDVNRPGRRPFADLLQPRRGPRRERVEDGGRDSPSVTRADKLFTHVLAGAETFCLRHRGRLAGSVRSLAAKDRQRVPPP
jgi:hypothetical protein